MKPTREEVLLLTVAERLELVDLILDTLPDEREAEELTPEQRDDLDRRIAEDEADPTATKTWAETREELMREAGAHVVPRMIARPLSALERDPKAILQSSKSTGDLIVLTVDGRAEYVVQDAAAYQRVLDRLDQLETIEGIRAGLEDVRAGRTMPLSDVVNHIRSRHDKPPPA